MDFCKQCARTHVRRCVPTVGPRPLRIHGGPAATETGPAAPQLLLPPAVGAQVVDRGACAAIVYKNRWVRKLKIGIRAKRESTNGKGDVLCITYRPQMASGWTEASVPR